MHPQDNHRFMLDMRMFELTLRYACCFLSGCFFVCFSHPGASLSYGGCVFLGSVTRVRDADAVTGMAQLRRRIH